MIRSMILIGGIGLGAVMAHASAPVVLVDSGSARCAIHVPPAVMADDIAVPRGSTFVEQTAETHRQRLRESVKDLARCLEVMSGATIPVLTRPPADGDAHLPLLVDAYASDRFGPPAVEASFDQGYRLVVTPQAVGFAGESHESTVYAIYTLLDRLGCRWYMPGALGEVLPSLPTLALDAVDISDEPDTPYRYIWYGSDAFKRRNRIGGFAVPAAHALASYLTEQQLTDHPEWNAEHDGERDLNCGFLCWGNPEVSDAVADAIVARLDARYMPYMSLAPTDGYRFCECELCTALDAGVWDSTMETPAITDRYIHFSNRVAERVGRKYPDVLFPFLAYVQYTRPPVRETPHPNLVPVIAPITYCRAHSMLSTNCPSRPKIKPVIEGWSRAARQIAYYNYMYNLAEVSVPYPMIRQMSEELPILYGAGARVFWSPETMPNFDSVLPGMWLSLRMAWDNSLEPEAVLDDLFEGFYGRCEAAMRRYWDVFDRAWMDVPEHAGCGWGHMRRFTPDVMQAARQAMDEALAGADTVTLYRRVKLFDDSLRQFERFMALRHDLAEGRLDKIDVRAQEWVGTEISLSDEYEANAAFTRAGWVHMISIGAGYFDTFFSSAYEDAGRWMYRRNGFMPVDRRPRPLRQWGWRFVSRDEAEDGFAHGESQGWHTPEADVSAWPITDTCVETWSTLGQLGRHGTMWYRAKVDVPRIPDGRRVLLWTAAHDTEAKVYVNGTPVSCVTADGQTTPTAKGYAKAFSFDITEAVIGNAGNDIAIAVKRTMINELGTGGLMGPAYLYRER